MADVEKLNVPCGWAYVCCIRCTPEAAVALDREAPVGQHETFDSSVRIVDN
ncbi:hypothetical protein J2W46_003537 [Paraburkholderia strydomiana]|nr:hypothetical protein [Paraburkholderia strydomiana]